MIQILKYPPEPDFPFREINFYSDKDLLLSALWVDVFGIIKRVYVYEYNEKDERVSGVALDSDGETVIGILKFSFLENGLLNQQSEFIVSDGKESELNRISYIYNEENLLCRANFYEKGNFVGYELFGLDRFGEVMSQGCYDCKGLAVEDILVSRIF